MSNAKWLNFSTFQFVKCFKLDFWFSLYRKILPPQTGELNVHFGVFFGGLGDFSETYLNSVDNFRGCMSDVSVSDNFYALLFLSVFFSSLFFSGCAVYS